MQTKYQHYLASLRRHGKLQAAARACGLTTEALRRELDELQMDYGPLLESEKDDAQLNAHGLRIAEWSEQFQQECSALRRDLTQMRQDRLMSELMQRRSVSPKRLQAPGPSDMDIESMVAAALCAPDHGGLHPWRVIRFAEADRTALAQLFEDEKRRRDPLAPAQDLARAREHALRSPALLAFVISPQVRNSVPLREQWLAAGAALGNFMNAAHRLGFGAIVLSGERCYDTILATALGLELSEVLGGFISLGTVAVQPPQRHPSDPQAQISDWKPAHACATGASITAALLQKAARES